MKLAKVSSLVMLFLWIALACNRAATAQPLPVAAESRKNELEVRKLELEVAALSDEKHVPVWVTGVLGFLGGVAGTVVTVWGARRARIGALDQAVHEKRIESYAGLVTTSAPLALCFPPGASICPNDCRAMGEAMRAWYFNGGGLLMSTG